MKKFGTVQPVTGDIGNKQAEEKIKSILQAKNNDLNKTAAEAVAGLEALEEQEKSVIPVGYFKSNFADAFQDMIDNNEAFTKNEKDSTKTTNEEVIVDWLKIAGGGHREVKLSNDKGEIVDIVPPIFNNTPALSPADNATAKEMTQAMLLAGEEGDSFHPLLDKENDKVEYLSAIGQKLGEGILSSEENAKNSQEFKRVVAKYSNKLSSTEVENLKVDDHIKRNDDLEFDID